MKLSDDTLQVLKNFSTINSNLVVKDDGVLRTMSEAKNVLADATISESFGGAFGIYDLGEFLSVYNMFDDPDLEFDDSYTSVTMKQGRSAVRYFFSDPEILTSPAKAIKMPSTDVTFELNNADLAAIRKAASALGVTEFVVSADDDGNLIGTVTDTKNKTANAYTIELTNSSSDIDTDFKFIFAIGNLKMPAGEWTVQISSKLISKFSTSDESINYFIALEKSSTIGA